MDEYHRHGDKATDLSDTELLMADDQVIRLAVESTHNRCARAILDACHESLAKLISNSIQQGEVQIPVTISGEIQAHIRADLHVCKTHRCVALQIAQEWVEGLIEKVNHYAKQNQQT